MFWQFGNWGKRPILLYQLFAIYSKNSTQVDTERKLNVHKTFRRHPGHLLNVLCTFNLRPVSTWTCYFFALQLLFLKIQEYFQEYLLFIIKNKSSVAGKRKCSYKKIREELQNWVYYLGIESWLVPTGARASQVSCTKAPISPEEKVEFFILLEKSGQLLWRLSPYGCCHWAIYHTIIFSH